MFQVPATVIGMVGSAFMIASFSPGAVGQAPNVDKYLEGGAQRVHMALKSDRLSAPIAVSVRHTVSVVELVGVSQVRVVLKDEDGRVLFRSEPQTNTTYFSRDTDLPVLTLKEESGSDVKRQPVSRESGEERTAPKRRAQPHGCIGAVSPLAQAGKEGGASLCVTGLDPSVLQG